VILLDTDHLSVCTDERDPRLAHHNHRTRQGQRRRRMATLETLESRTLLSNVVTSFTHDAITGAV
jgi:hypothetical protein